MLILRRHNICEMFRNQIPGVVTCDVEVRSISNRLVNIAKPRNVWLIQNYVNFNDSTGEV